MPVRHFYLLSHYICYSLFFLFSACWLQRNERNSLWENKGERSDVYCLLGRYLCHGILFTCSHITFVMVYSFYFLLVGSRRNEFNSLWGDKGGYVRSLLLARKVYHPEEKDDILSQYNSEFIVYNDSWRYHLISMTVSRR